MFQGWPSQMIEAMQETRKEAIRADAIRALLFGLATFALLWFTVVMPKIKKPIAFAALMAIIAVDMLPYDLKAINHDTFVTKKQNDNVVTKTAADEFILQDKDPHYRVFKFGNSFNDAFTSKYHKSIGGYSAAKLSRYQDLIDYSYTPFIQNVSAAKTVEEQQNALFSCQAMNMLNCKYFIVNPNAAPVVNENAFGNAWFAYQYSVCDGAYEEINMTNRLCVKEEIVVDKKFESLLGNKPFAPDSTANIKLAEYHPNHLKYTYASAKEQIAVFSEVYYAPNGWQAYLDGEKVEHFRANYILRAMVVPAGNHTIEFKFEPESYTVGTKISLASSYLLYLLLVGGVLFELFKYWKKRKGE